MMPCGRIPTSLAACWIALASSALADNAKPVSKYTSTARAKSISYHETGEEGDPGFEALCPGLGGYKLEFLGGDDRSWINPRFGSETADLYKATMEAGGGTFPNKANDVVEWRGVEKNGRFIPYAIIYRIEAGNDETRQTHTRLVVIKLDRARSAVIGHTEGAHEEEEARAMADRAGLAGRARPKGRSL
jgi:hypothetical protein